MTEQPKDGGAVITASEAANVLLEHIMFHDLEKRRGSVIANAVIDEIAEIASREATQ